PPTLSPPFVPYTTLFRSVGDGRGETIEVRVVGCDRFLEREPLLDALLKHGTEVRAEHSVVVEAVMNAVLSLLPDEGIDVLQQIRSEEHTSELQSRGHVVC